MGRRGVTLLRRTQEPARRLAQIQRNAGAGGIKTTNDKLGADVAQLRSAAIPLGGLVQIRGNAFTAREEFSKRDDRGKIILLRRLTQISFRLVEILRQAAAAQMHERGIIQAACLSLLCGFDEQSSGLFLIRRSPLAG